MLDGLCCKLKQREVIKEHTEYRNVITMVSFTKIIRL